MRDPDAVHAVWDGRFQPFHVGHLAVIRAILEQFGCPLVVMIIQSSPEPAANAYTAQVNVHHALARNPLTLWERYELLRLVLSAEGLEGRVSVLGIPRPDMYWPIASRFYPRRRFICLTDKDEYERAKVTFWHALEEETRVVDTRGLPAVSGTRVTEWLKSAAGWRELRPAAARDSCERIGGPERFRAADL